MSYSSQLKAQIDLPVWEWLRFAPTTTTAVSACTAPGPGTPTFSCSASLCGGTSGSLVSTGSYGSNRYMFYIVGSSFYRYDTYTDGWQTLSSPPITPTNAVALKYSSQNGFYGRVLSATSGSIRSATLTGQRFAGYRIKIISGTGAGQERNIIGVSDPIISDYFLVTTGSTFAIFDQSKTWKYNQWAGYQARLTIGSGAGQLRRILYNNNTGLYLQDNARYAIDPVGWGAPLATTTAVSSSFGYIESSNIYVDVPWTIIPDQSSEFNILSGGVWCLTSAPTSTAGYCLMYYDVLTDIWYNKMTPNSMWASNAAATCNDTLETLTESPIIYLTGSLSVPSSSYYGSLISGSYPILVDASKSLPINSHAFYALTIVSGSGMGQRRTIIANSGSYFYINRPFTTSPDTNSIYKITGDYDKLFVSGLRAASLFKYSMELDMWSPSVFYDTGYARPIAASKPGWEPLGLLNISLQTGGISNLSSTPTVGGSAYDVNDLLTITTGGTGGIARVLSVDNTGSVLSVALENPGLGYTTGTGKATTSYPVGGSGCTLNIVSISNMCVATSSVPHYFSLGDTASIILGASAPTDYTCSIVGAPIIGVPTTSSFTYAIPTTPNPLTQSALSNTTLIDCTKQWAINEHVGKLVMFHDVITVNTAGTSSLNKITANNSCSLTMVSTGYVPASAKSKYSIVDMRFNGCVSSVPWSDGEGFVTSGSLYGIIDNTKNWPSNNWANKKIRIIAGTGVGQEVYITASNSNTIFLSGSTPFTIAPTTASIYSIEDCYGVATAGSVTTLTDSTQNWPYNVLIGGKVRMAGGTGGVVYAGAANPLEGAITSNTNNILTFTTVTTTGPTTNTPYSIIHLPSRGASDKLIWAYNNIDPVDPYATGKYMYFFRGGGTALVDRYNISTRRYQVIQPYPIGDVFNTGTMYSYDGGNKIYITNNNTGRIYSLDVIDHNFDGSGIVPYGMSTAIIGNRMEIFQSQDGVKFLYLLRHSGSEMWRTMLFI